MNVKLDESVLWQLSNNIENILQIEVDSFDFFIYDLTLQ